VRRPDLTSGRRRRPTGLLAVVLAAALTVALTACTGPRSDGSAGAGTATASTSAPDPAALLTTARATLDATPSLGFVLQSKDVPAAGTALVGGTGDLERPDGFQGTLDVRIGENLTQVEVVSVGGQFYAKLPFTTDFSPIDPKSLGFTDPGTFMDPDTGISQLLSQAKDPVLGDETRIVGEVAREVRATLPGALVADLLISADPTADVEATFAVTTDGDELRRAVLVGPFFEKGTMSTYTIVLRDYGKSVSISAPTPAS
jgi:lipoprotein LprG